MAHAKPNYSPPTMPTFCNDWLTSRSVAALPVAGEALFMRLLLAEWQSGALPDDIEQIMTFTGYRKEFPEVWPQVRALFTLTPDGLINERLEEIRAQWESRSETKRAAANARWDAEKMQKPCRIDADRDAKPMPSVSVSASTSDTDSTTPPTPQKPKVQIPNSLTSEGFIQAWDAWVAHRKEKRIPLTPTSIRQQFKKLEAMGQKRACDAIWHSIEKGYTGIYEENSGGWSGQKSAPGSIITEDRNKWTKEDWERQSGNDGEMF